MMIATFVSIILFAVSAIVYKFKDVQMLVIVTFIIMMILLVISIVIYYRYVKFVCPKCNQMFKPSKSAITCGIHTLTKRYLKCPHCNTKSWCKEHFD